MTQVKGPDGQVHTFPDNAPPEAIQAALREFYKLAPPPPKKEGPGMLSGTATEAASGFTLGAADYVNALSGPITDAISGKFGADESWPPDGIQQLPTSRIADSYRRSFEGIRADRGQFREEHPVASVGSNLVGGVAAITPLAGTIAKGAAAALPNSPRAAASLAGGLTGATAGGITGGLEAPPGANLEGAAWGAGTGFGIGMAAPPLFRLAGALWGKTAAPLVQKLKDRFGTGPATAGQRKLLEKLQQDGLTPDQIAARLDKMGPEATIPDAAGESTLGLADTLTNSPGPAREMAKKAYEPRQRTQGDRLYKAAQDGLGAKGDFHGQIDDLLEKRRADSTPAYDEAFNTKFVWDERLERITNHPDVQKGIQRGYRIQNREAVARDQPFDPKDYGVTGFNEAGDPVISGKPNLRALDAGKRGLDAMIDDAQDQYGRVQWTQELKSIDELRKALVSKLDELTGGAEGAYAKARAIYAGPSKLMDAARMGRDFAKGDFEVTAKVINDMSPGEKELFREGTLRQLRSIIDSTQDGRNVAAKLIRTPKMRDALRATFPDSKSFNNFALTALREDKFSTTKNTLLGNSRTAMRDAGRDDVGIDPGMLVNAGNDPISAGLGIVRHVMKGAKDMPEAQKEALAGMLFSKDRGQQKAALASLSQMVVRGQIAPQAYQALRQLVSGGIAAEEGGRSGRNTAP